MKCEICNDVDYKYTCPGCNLKTCSVKCCKEHKILKNCNGVRDKTKYIKLTEFSEKELLSDYTFLEEQSRLIDSTKRDTLLANNKRREGDVTPSMDYLRKLAFQKYSIYLKFMPKNSTKRLNNKTRFDKLNKTISWYLEFDINNSGNIISFDELVDPELTLNDVLNKFYNKNELKLIQIDESFKNYNNNNNFNLLFEIRDFKLKEKYFIKFDLNKSLNDNLNKKHLIEYPILKLVSDDKIHLYKLKQDKNTTSANTTSNDLEEGELEEEEEEENDDGNNDYDQNDDHLAKRLKLDDFEAILNNPNYNSFESGVRIERF